ncbi:hypothetical protein OZX57_08525 [Bifidobacterium sp. ESL0682]|uniref:hypothetical protein n=1 Tax=Bifidobacterium sp. ESL0682 TaxID=2983212 RepID=UPI0023F99F9E|nr:hypothetical protein [Bifidobacterium sp. ESL0682]WEV41963.1 hypothetical protein OZX57_08525 [Bifidobacterium sp. ESL0682]
MAIRKGLRDVAAALLSASMVLACGVVGMGVANAAPIPITVSGNDGQITIKNAGSDHNYKAVQIAKYDSAYQVNSKISEVKVASLSSSSQMNTAISTALTQMGTTIPTTTECNTDAMCWISMHWLGFNNGSADNSDKTSERNPYVGKLRDFVTALHNDQTNFRPLINGSGFTATTNGTTAVFTGLPEGLYVVEDYTSSSSSNEPNSIPMLVGTTLGSSSEKFNQFESASVPNTGEITAKTDSPTVSKRLEYTTNAGNRKKKQGEALADGDIMHFLLLTKVPMTTGFSKYFFRVTDLPSAGLQYINNSRFTAPKVTVNGVNKDVIPAPGTAIVPAPDKVYLNQTPVNGSQQLGFTFPQIMSYTQGSKIEIRYSMKITGTGHQNNVAGIDWSSDVNNQPNNNCIADPAANCGTVHHSDTATYSMSSYYMTLRNIDGADREVPIGGATYKVLQNGSPLTFRKLGDGHYVYHSGDDTQVTTNVVASTQTGVQGARAISFVQPKIRQVAEDNEGLGCLKLDGLALGTYTIEEVAPPASKPNAELLKFDVKFTADDSNHGTYVSLLRDYNGGLVQKPVASSDHLGATLSVNVTKQSGGIMGVINSFRNGMFGSGSLAQTGVSLLILLVLLCCLLIAGTMILSRRHQISR